MQKRITLMDYLKSHEILNKKDIDSLLLISKSKILKKGEFLILEGEVCEELSLVDSGLLHSYSLSETLEEITNYIFFPNEFVSAYSSYFFSQKSQVSIQALTKTKLTVLPKRELNQLMNSNYNIHRCISAINESYLIKLEKRFLEFQKYDARRRYFELVKNKPEFILNVPLKFLASYLGITPRHLSRIRASQKL